MPDHHRSVPVVAALLAAQLASVTALAGNPVVVVTPPPPPSAPPPVIIIRPPPPDRVVGCSLWEGMIHGNDPSVMVRMRLCQAGAHVWGRLQWSSLRSGWNERDVDGTATPDGQIVLRDLRIVSSAPAPGVRFCPIDRYAFRFASPIQMLGNYDSFACRDHAVVELHRI